MRTTVLIAAAIGAAVPVFAASLAVNGLTVWAAVWSVAIGLAGTAVWIRLKAHLGEARRSREFIALRQRMVTALHRQRRLADAYREANLEPEGAAVDCAAEHLDGALQ